MTKTIKATAKSSLAYSFQNEDEVAITQENYDSLNKSEYTFGDGPNEAEIMWRKQVTLTAASPNYDVDLHAELRDVFGDSVAFRNVRWLLIKNLSTESGDDLYAGPLGVDDGFSSPWGGDGSAKNTVRASGGLTLDAPKDGFSTISGEGHVLRLQYQGTSGSINAVVLALGLEGVTESSSSSSVSSSWSSYSSSSSASSSSSSSNVSSSSSTSSSTSSEEFSTSCAASKSSLSTSSALLAESSGGSSASSESSSSSSTSSASSSSSTSGDSSSSSPSSSSSCGGSSASTSSSSSSSSPATSSSSSAGVDCIDVSGATYPTSPNGQYAPYSVYEGRTTYKLNGGAWYIWWKESASTWLLTDEIGVEAGPRWTGGGADWSDPFGTYSPVFGSTALGTITATEC